MPATVRSSSTYASAATEASTSGLALPPGWQPGDVIYIGCELTAATGSITTPSGWTAVVAQFVSAVGGTPTSGHAAVYRRVMQSGDTAPVISFTSGRFAAGLVAVQGADNVTPEDVTPASDDNTGVTVPSVRAPSVTPVTDNCLLLTFHAVRNLTSGVLTSFTPDASEIEQADAGTSVAAVSEAAVEAASLALGAAAATGTKTATATGSNVTSLNIMGAAVAVRPAAVAGAGSPAQPGKTWLRRFHHRQQVFPPAAAVPAAAVLVPQRGAPVQARQLPGRGGQVISRARAAPFTVVQAAPTVESPSLTTATVTLGSPTTAGNTLVAVITTFGATTLPAVSGLTLGGAADNWQAAVTDGAHAFGAAIWYDPNCAGGQTSAVVNCTGGSGTSPSIYIAVYEVSGVLSFDKGSSNGALAATSWTSNATATTAQAAEIFVGVSTAQNALPTVTGAGTWTTQNSVAGAFDQISGTQIVAATGTATFSGTVASSNYVAVVATFSAVPPAAGAGPPVYPLGHPVQARRQPLRGGSANRRSGVYDGTGPAVKAAQGPVRARVPQPSRGGSATARKGVFGGAGPALKALAQAVASKLRGFPPRGRTAARSGTFGQLGPAAKAAAAPVQARRLPARGGSTQGRAGTFTATAVQAGPPVYPLGHPVQARRLPQRGGRVTSRSGTLTPGAPQAGPPVYPLGHPVQARRQPLAGGRVVRRAGTYQQTGPPARPLRQPTGTGRQQPPPPARGRTASQRGPYGQAGPPVIRLRHPVRGQPQRPVLTGRAGWRTGTYTAPSAVQAATSTATVTAQDTSLATVTDPRDGSASATAATTSAPAVTDPRDGTATVTGGAVTIPAAGLLDESGSPVTGESGGFILLEDGS